MRRPSPPEPPAIPSKSSRLVPLVCISLICTVSDLSSSSNVQQEGSLRDVFLCIDYHLDRVPRKRLTTTVITPSSVDPTVSPCTDPPMSRQQNDLRTLMRNASCRPSPLLPLRRDRIFLTSLLDPGTVALSMRQGLDLSSKACDKVAVKRQHVLSNSP